jgi:hypothetical protein
MCNLKQERERAWKKELYRHEVEGKKIAHD